MKPPVNSKIRALIDKINSNTQVTTTNIHSLIINKKQICTYGQSLQNRSLRISINRLSTPKQIDKIEKKSSRVSTSTSLNERKKSIDKENKHQSKQSKVIGTQFKNKISAKAWIVYDPKEKLVVAENNSTNKMEMASITKIMTLITTLDLLSIYGIDPEKLKLMIPERAQNTNGTSAKLKQKNLLYMKDVFYGLMLPSGNDAAVTIALYMGTIINALKNGDSIDSIYNHQTLFSRMIKDDTNMRTFLVEMNTKAQFLKMQKTRYANPHGLSNKNNYSTCRDLVKLCQYSMRNKIFSSIVSTTRYRAQCLLTKNSYQWQNTHKLLEQGWKGIKTGNTPAAGPCLTSYWCGKIGGCFKQVVVVLLNSSSPQARWKQTKMLKNHYFNQ